MLSLPHCHHFLAPEASKPLLAQSSPIQYGCSQPGFSKANLTNVGMVGCSQNDFTTTKAKATAHCIPHHVSPNAHHRTASPTGSALSIPRLYINSAKGSRGLFLLFGGFLVILIIDSTWVFRRNVGYNFTLAKHSLICIPHSFSCH